MFCVSFEFVDKDLHVKEIKNYKIFHDNHLSGAKYKATEGKALILSQEVRWNTLANSLETYV